MNLMLFSLIFTFTLLDSIFCHDCSSQKVTLAIDVLDNTIDESLEVNAEEFLWHVAVLKQGETSLVFLCSGTVFQGRFVLTAAHCVDGVLASELRLVAGLTTLRSPSQAVDNPHHVYSVSEKYFPYHQDGFIKEDDLAILKLHNKITHTSPVLRALSFKGRLSKHCFTLGWGMQYHADQLKDRCLTTSVPDVISSFVHHQRLSRPVLSRALDIRNTLGLSSMFMFTAGKILDIFSDLIQHKPLRSKLSRDETCSTAEYAQLKIMRVSAKHHYKCLCPDSTHLCVYGWDTDDLAEQIDIGSPVFCKIKKPKLGNSCSRERRSTTQFGLAGIITRKFPEHISLLLNEFPVMIMKATNISHFSEFLFSVLRNEMF